MITCEKDRRVSFHTSNTCITRQFFIKEQGPRETPGMIRPNNGQIIDCSICVGCKTGLKFFKEGKMMEKRRPGRPKRQKPIDGLQPVYDFESAIEIKPKPVTETKGEKKEIPAQTFSRCKKPLPLTAEFFHVKKDRVNGFRHECKKKCRAKYRMENKNEARIILDLTDMPDLLEKIQSWAKQEFRDPDKQIIYFLNKSVDALV